MNLTKFFLDPAAILELFLNRKRGNAGSLCIKHGTLSIVSHYITLHHIVSVGIGELHNYIIICCKNRYAKRTCICADGKCHFKGFQLNYE